MVKNKQQIMGRVKNLSNNSVIAAMMVAATIVVVLSVLLTRELWGDVRFNQRVLGAKNQANSTLNNNVEVLDELRGNFENLEEEGPQPIQVLEALPTDVSYDSLAAQLEAAAVLTNTRLVAVTPQSLFEELDVVDSGVQIVQFRAAGTGTYQNLQRFLANIQSSVRPIQINNVSISGTEPQVTADILFTTYFYPPASVEPKTETINEN